MSTPFVLDSRLAGDCHVVTDLPLCQLLLMDDSRYPWLILVPRLPGLRELADLDREQQHRLLDEIATATNALRAFGDYDKLNIGALGNIVEQLHVHVIARRTGDFAWPAPVWGNGARLAYTDAAATIQRIRKQLTT